LRQQSIRKSRKVGTLTDLVHDRMTENIRHVTAYIRRKEIFND
jgi:hypothetical protein